MSYLGNAPARSFISFERQVFTIVNSQTAYALSHSVTNENDIRLVVNNVVQEPGSGKAYTATGTALTLSAALTNGTDEMYCVFLGRATATSAPGAGSVSTAQIVDGAVTSAKLSYPLTTFSSTGIDDNADALAMTIDSSEQVGIGETAPLGKLHVKTADTGASAVSGNANELVIENTGNVGMTIQSANDGVGNIYFGDVANGSVGRVSYDHSNNFMSFNTNASERMRITSAGHITAPNLNTTGSTSNRYPLYWVHSGTTGSIEPYTGSIRAMKTDINDMGSVDWIHSLTPRSFKFRDYETDEDGSKVYLETTNDLPNTEYGLIAEEVNEVSGSDYILDKQIDEDGNENLKGVLYHNLVPVLLKAVQEQKTKIDELEARITTLENK